MQKIFRPTKTSKNQQPTNIFAKHHQLDFFLRGEGLVGLAPRILRILPLTCSWNTRPKTSISQMKRAWLEGDFPFWNGPFSGNMTIFGEVNGTTLHPSRHLEVMKQLECGEVALRVAGDWSRKNTVVVRYEWKTLEWKVPVDKTLEWKVPVELLSVSNANDANR